MSNSHTKFGWISSNGLGDSITDGQTDGGDYNFPFAFFNKRDLGPRVAHLRMIVYKGIGKQAPLKVQL